MGKGSWKKKRKKLQPAGEEKGGDGLRKTIDLGGKRRPGSFGNLDESLKGVSKKQDKKQSTN